MNPHIDWDIPEQEEKILMIPKLFCFVFSQFEFENVRTSAHRWRYLRARWTFLFCLHLSPKNLKRIERENFPVEFNSPIKFLLLLFPFQCWPLGPKVFVLRSQLRKSNSIKSVFALPRNCLIRFASSGKVLWALWAPKLQKSRTRRSCNRTQSTFIVNVCLLIMINANYVQASLRQLGVGEDVLSRSCFVSLNLVCVGRIEACLYTKACGHNRLRRHNLTYAEEEE